MITPVDLETTVFHRGWRGYNTREIQEFMTKISHDYEYLYRENINLKEKIDELTAKLSQYQLMEENLRNAIVMAQKSADDLKESSQAKANAMLMEAKQQSEEIKLRVKGEIQMELQNLASLKNQVDFFRCQFRNFLQTMWEAAEKQPSMEVTWNNTPPKVQEVKNDNSAYAEAAATVEKESLPADQPAEENKPTTTQAKLDAIGY